MGRWVMREKEGDRREEEVDSCKREKKF